MGRSRSRAVRSASVGVVAGFLSGLFGVGGGILIVPGLVFIGLPQRLAHGTSLAAIVPIAVAGVGGFAFRDSIDWVAAGLIALGAAAGAVVGTRALHVLPQRSLRLAFVAFMLVAAVELLIEIPSALGRGGVDPWMVLGLAGLGLVSGTLGGLLGVGGGIVIVPALVLLFAVPDAVAKGTSLAVIIPTAVVGTARNVATRNADLGVAMVVGLFGVASAFGASQLAVLLSPRLSAVTFAILLVAVAVNMLWQDRRARRRDGPAPAEAKPG